MRHKHPKGEIRGVMVRLDPHTPWRFDEIPARGDDGHPLAAGGRRGRALCAEQLFRPLYYVFYGKAKLFHEYFVRCGGAKPMYSDNVSLRSYIPFPPERRRGFDGQTTGHVRWQHFLTICRGLTFEDLP